MNPKNTLWVGGARNLHGTRISKKISCQKCGKIDYITSKPSKEQGAFCRDCAKEFIGALEIGKRQDRDMTQYNCSRCKKIFDFPSKMEPKKDCLCKNCLRGFEIWQGSSEMSEEEQSKLIREKRDSGTILRKKEA